MEVPFLVLLPLVLKLRREVREIMYREVLESGCSKFALNVSPLISCRRDAYTNAVIVSNLQLAMRVDLCEEVPQLLEEDRHLLMKFDERRR